MIINVGIFFGGSSVEHEVSVISAIQSITALDKTKYNPVPIYITKEGILYTGEKLSTVSNYKNLDKLLSECNKIAIVKEKDEFILYRVPGKKFSSNILNKIDIAFPIVHGNKCEDGTVQGLLELLSIPYVGCNVLSSALGMDKVMMKYVLKESDIPVLDCISFYIKEWSLKSESLLEKIEKNIPYPVIVKPVNLGSSVGVQKADTRIQLEESINLASSFSNKILVEKAIDNLKEINCAVIGDCDDAQSSSCEEPIGNDQILSYNDKYLNKSSNKGMSSLKRKLPAELDKHVEDEIRSLSVKTFQALGCSGVSRIDFLIDQNDNNKVYVNEINTIPGSLAFYLWESTDLPFTKMLDKLIELAFKRDRESKNLIHIYETNILSMSDFSGGKNKL